MSGTLALVGSGEFLDAMRPTDALLLDKVGGPTLARVVVLPTASAPDGRAVFERWAALGRTHFAALGASVGVVMLARREDASDPAIVGQIAAANVVYLSGGKPGFLLQTLRGTPAWAAIEQVYARGGVLAGCSAGAMVLGGALLTPRLRLGRPWLFEDAFGLVPGSVILPHYDAMPAWIGALVRRSLPPSFTLLGIDEHTALISGGDSWTVHGRAGVEVSYAGKQQRYHSGERMVL
jgi:cyanophycinase